MISYIDNAMRKFVGLSTDAKPVAGNGDRFKEMDTGNEYIYDAYGSSWYQLPAAGASVSGGYVGPDVPRLSSSTITPGASSQVAASAGVYTTGNLIVEAIPPAYVIPSGTLNVSSNGTVDCGSYASVSVNVSGGGGSSAENDIIMRTISGTYENNEVTSLGSYAFAYCSNLISATFGNITILEAWAFASCYSLETVSASNITRVGASAFCACSDLKSISFPNAKSIYQYAFSGCTALVSVNLPIATMVSASAFLNCRVLRDVIMPSVIYLESLAFSGCTALSTLSFQQLSVIYSSAFYKCYNLLSLYLLGSTVTKLSLANAFTSTPISTYTASTGGVNGSIYVRASLLDTYKTSTNWITYSDRFVGLTDAQIAALG